MTKFIPSPYSFGTLFTRERNNTVAVTTPKEQRPRTWLHATFFRGRCSFGRVIVTVSVSGYRVLPKEYGVWLSYQFNTINEYNAGPQATTSQEQIHELWQFQLQHRTLANKRISSGESTHYEFHGIHRARLIPRSRLSIHVCVTVNLCKPRMSTLPEFFSQCQQTRFTQIDDNIWTSQSYISSTLDYDRSLKLTLWF